MTNSWRVALIVFLFLAQGVILVVYLGGHPIQNVSDVQTLATALASEIPIRKVDGVNPRSSRSDVVER